MRVSSVISSWTGRRRSVRTTPSSKRRQVVLRAGIAATLLLVPVVAISDIGDSSMETRGVLPVPAVFAIDAGGTVRYVYTNADYKVRLPAEDVLDVARTIADVPGGD